MAERKHIVVVGGGFAGLNAVKKLAGEAVDITLVDKHNYHLFWPLLYQVATAGLSPGDIAEPLRAMFSKHKNVRVLMGQVVDLDPDEQTIMMEDGDTLHYDALIVAAGFRYHYFGNDKWGKHAFDMQGMNHALAIRRHILMSFEEAEEEIDPAKREAILTFVIVGGGPTGVELAGSIAEMARHTLKEDFRHIDPATCQILLLERSERILDHFPPQLSQKAQEALEKLGVTVRTNTEVKDVEADHVVVSPKSADENSNDESERISTYMVMWAAGVKAAPLSEALHQRTGVELNRGGQVKVNPDLSIPGCPNIFVVGDMAYFEQDGERVPGIAPTAIQEGEHAAVQALRLLRGQPTETFRYVDKGMMATIGRTSAVADIRGLKLNGFPAWLIWLSVHLLYLVGFDNRVLVFIQWAWHYVSYKRGVRLIVEEDGEYDFLSRKRGKLQESVSRDETGAPV